MRRIISASVPRVEGVLADRPIDVLLDEFGPSALIFRVRWWVHSYSDARYIQDRVHSALYRALGEAGIHLPVPIQDVNLKLDRQTVNETIRQ